jgi:hypothetical protein
VDLLGAHPTQSGFRVDPGGPLFLVWVYTYMYIYIYIYVCVYRYIHTYMYRFIDLCSHSCEMPSQPFVKGRPLELTYLICTHIGTTETHSQTCVRGQGIRDRGYRIWVREVLQGS